MSTMKIDIYSILQRISQLEQQKAQQIELIMQQTKPRKLISEEVRNNTALSLFDELREIEDKIHALKSVTVTIDKELLK